MSTSDTTVAQQGKKHRYTTTQAQPNAMPHYMNNFQAHSLNSQTMIDYPPQPATPPRTPQRTEAITMAPAEINGYTSNDATSLAPNSSVNMKSKVKGRPKHVVTSPSAPRNIRATPPLNGAQSAGLPRTGKTPNAYAGPTFHASPAPSALPLPSFCSRSVPESPAPISLNSAQDETETSSDGSSDSPTPPTAQLSGAKNHREESPLDFFFVADRAERARVRGSSSGTGPFQPPFESPPANQTPTNPVRSNSSHFSGGRPSSMFAMEMDSPSTRKPMGASFATPYNERMKAARSVSSQSQPSRNSPHQGAFVGSQSQALNDYVFYGTTASAPAVPTLSSCSIRSASGPSTPVGGPQYARHPSRPEFASVYYNSPRTSSRASGLRQEVSQNKTPVKNPGFSERVTSAPPKMSNHLPFVNNDPVQYMNPRISSQNPTPSGSLPHSISSPLPNGGLAHRPQSDNLLDLEDRLRQTLRLSPAKNPGGNSFPYGPPAPVHRAASMNNGGYNGVGGHQS